MEKTKRLYLIRHGQIIGHDTLPINGHTDVGVTEEGVSQIERVARRLSTVDIQAIYSSDLTRSVEGARIIARHHSSPVLVRPECKEMFFGDWEGKTLSEIHEQDPGALDRRKKDIAHFQPPGNGESVVQLSKRVLPCLKSILGEREEGNIVLVGHGVVNRVILADAMGLDLTNVFNIQQDYGCLNIIDYFSDGSMVTLING